MTRKAYFLNNEEVAKPTKVNINGNWVYSPSDEQIIMAGYEIRMVEVKPDDPYIPTYSELVEQYIRENGYPTYGSELAVINNYTDNPTEYTDAWLTYQGVRVAAKEWANEQQHRDDE